MTVYAAVVCCCCSTCLPPARGALKAMVDKQCHGQAETSRQHEAEMAQLREAMSDQRRELEVRAVVCCRKALAVATSHRRHAKDVSLTWMPNLGHCLETGHGCICQCVWRFLWPFTRIVLSLGTTLPCVRVYFLGWVAALFSGWHRNWQRRTSRGWKCKFSSQTLATWSTTRRTRTGTFHLA